MWLWITLLLVGVAVVVPLLWKPLRSFMEDVRTEKAKELFALQRERLEAKFTDMAKASGLPRGLRWKHIEWDDGVIFLRSRRTGELIALVGITIYFEPEEGGGLEDNPNARLPRDGTAIFQFAHQHWVATGRVLFNMDPTVAMRHYERTHEVLSAFPRKQHADNP